MKQLSARGSSFELPTRTELCELCVLALTRHFSEFPHQCFEWIFKVNLLGNPGHGDETTGQAGPVM